MQYKVSITDATGLTLLSLVISMSLSSGVLAVTCKYYAVLKSIIEQQQACITLLHKKEIVYSFLKADIYASGWDAPILTKELADVEHDFCRVTEARKYLSVIVMLATLHDIYRQTANRVSDKIITKLIDKISNQQIKPGSAIVLILDMPLNIYSLREDIINSPVMHYQHIAYYLAKDKTLHENYTLFRDDFGRPAVGLADQVINFKVIKTLRKDKQGDLRQLLSFLIEYVITGEHQANCNNKLTNLNRFWQNFCLLVPGKVN